MIASKPQKTNVSYYSRPSVFSNTMHENERFDVYDEMFTDKQEGFVKLEGDTFTPDWTGLMKVSGFCRVKYAPNVLAVSIGNLFVAETDSRVVTFTATLPAQPVKIGVTQDLQANFVMCNLLFEAVK